SVPLESSSRCVLLVFVQAPAYVIWLWLEFRRLPFRSVGLVAVRSLCWLIVEPLAAFQVPVLVAEPLAPETMMVPLCASTRPSLRSEERRVGEGGRARLLLVPEKEVVLALPESARAQLS